MKNLLAGAAALAIAAAFGAPAMAQTMQSDPAVTGVSPQGTPLVASACNESDLAQTESKIGEAPEDLRPALMQRLAVARDFGNDNQRQQCAQELARIETIIDARSASAAGTARMTGSSGMSNTTGMTGSSSTGTVGTVGTMGAAGAGAAALGTSSAPDQAVAASCNETDLAEVSSMISEAPESQQEILRQRLNAARNLGSDQENLECAQELAEIRQIVRGGTGSTR